MITNSLSFFENLEKSRVATEYIHATPTLRPAFFMRGKGQISQKRLNFEEESRKHTCSHLTLCSASPMVTTRLIVLFPVGTEVKIPDTNTGLPTFDRGGMVAVGGVCASAVR